MDTTKDWIVSGLGKISEISNSLLRPVVKSIYYLYVYTAPLLLAYIPTTT
jgi:hypothetical protein